MLYGGTTRLVGFWSSILGLALLTACLIVVTELGLGQLWFYAVFLVLIVCACLGASTTGPGMEFEVVVRVTFTERPPLIMWFYPTRTLFCSTEDLAHNTPERLVDLLRHFLTAFGCVLPSEPLSLLSNSHCLDSCLCGHSGNCSV
jgi:hypothetical protein